MLAAERIIYIMDILQKNKSVMVSELSKTLNVSEETIRRDLEKLEKKKRIRRVHGGAFLLEGFEKGVPVVLRKKFFTEEKRRMGKICVGFIKDRDIILLDCSSTSLFIAKEIKESRLQVIIITNSLDIITELSDCSTIELISLGGTFRERTGSFNGYNTLDMLKGYCADKAFISCSAVNLKNGMMDHCENEAKIRQLMLERANNNFLVVDHTKIGYIAANAIGELGAIDYFITDRDLEDQWITKLEDNNINYIIG